MFFTWYWTLGHPLPRTGKEKRQAFSICHTALLNSNFWDNMHHQLKVTLQTGIWKHSKLTCLHSLGKTSHCSVSLGDSPTVRSHPHPRDAIWFHLIPQNYLLWFRKKIEKQPLSLGLRKENGLNCDTPQQWIWNKIQASIHHLSLVSIALIKSTTKSNFRRKGYIWLPYPRSQSTEPWTLVYWSGVCVRTRITLFSLSWLCSNLGTSMAKPPAYLFFSGLLLLE